MYFGKTNLVTPLSQFNVVNKSETTFGNLLYHRHDTISTVSTTQFELWEWGLKNRQQHHVTGIYHNGFANFV